MPDEPKGILGGRRVIDLATERAEMAGRILSDLGAEVIKVEPPGGCKARTMPPFAGDGREPRSLYWAAVGLGKKSVVLDIEQEADRERLRSLLRTADVFIESFDPGYLKGLGLDYETVRALNPALVYVSVTPYGQTGPEAHSPASELVLEAAAGRSMMQSDPDRPPSPLGFPQTAFHSGAQAAADACTALLERERSGLGQYLDVSMHSVMLWTLMVVTGPAAMGTRDPNGSGYPPTDDAPPAAAAGWERSFARQMWEVKGGWAAGSLGLGAPGLISLRAIMNWAKEEGALAEQCRDVDWFYWQQLVAEGKLALDVVEQAVHDLEAFLKTKTKREVMDMAVAHDLMFSPIYDLDEVVHDPHLAANHYWQQVNGRQHPGFPARFSEEAVELHTPAPALGEHQSLVDAPRAPTVVRASAARQPRKQAFDGVKVADFSWLGVGPISSKALADNGATVVRIESELKPDLLRHLGPFKDNVPGINRSQFYGGYNTSKLSVALDLGRQEAREIAAKLVDWADIVFESYRPGAMARLGFDYATLSKKKPGLIMFSTCIRGNQGPEQRFPGTGAQGAALCGMGSLVGWPDRQPTMVAGAYTDVIVPRYAQAILAAAVARRERTGRGLWIDMPQVEPGVSFLEPLILDYTVNGRIARRQGQDSLYSCPRGVYQTSGIRRFIAIEVETPEQWRALKAIAPLDAFADASFDSLEKRMEHRDAINAVVAEWCRPQEAGPLAEQLKAAGIPASSAYYAAELFENEQLLHRGFFVPLQHPEMGLVRYDGIATHYSETQPVLRKAAPCLGEDTFHVLHDFLGMPPEEIAALAEQGVFK